MKKLIFKKSVATFGAVGIFALSGCTKQTPDTFRPAPVRQSKGLVSEEQVDVTKYRTEQYSENVEKQVPVTKSSPQPYQVPVTKTKEESYQVPVTKTKDETYQAPKKITKTVMEDVQVTKKIETVTKRPVDMLLVVDNSSSMEPSQEKLRRALRGFAQTYLKPTNDIRIGVITTDTYLANPAFSEYWNGPVPGSKKRFPPNGMRYNEVHPVVGPSYAKLLPGIHDGPVPTFCSPLNPDFYNGPSRCSVRDSMQNQGPDHCLNPAAGESSLTECVNTVKNNSIHSGSPIISTLNADPEKVIRDFIVNVSVGTSGSGSERGIESVAQFLRDNEGTATRLFRKDSLKVIAFLSDEDDQSMVTPEHPGSGFSPYSGYSKKCPRLNADGFSYTLSMCIADERDLIPVETYKAQFDAFFQALDGTTANYFVAPIVTKTGQTVARLQKLQRQMQSYGGKHQSPTDQDIGRRYIRLAEVVGNGSMAFDIGASDYTPILNAMFQKLVTNKTETVQRPKTVEETVMETKTRQVPYTVQETRTKQVPYTVMEDRVRNVDVTVMESRTEQVQKTRQVPYTVKETHRSESNVIALDRTPLSPEAVLVSVAHADGSSERLAAGQFKVEGKTLTITDAAVLQRMSAADQVTVLMDPLKARE